MPEIRKDASVASIVKAATGARWPPRAKDSDVFASADANNCSGTTTSPNSGNVVAIEVHHFVPRRGEVFHKLLLGVRACIDFRDSTQLRMRPEDQVCAGSGPLDLVGLPVAAFI